MPKDWGFFNDLELVVAGYDEWEASDFQRFPDKNEVADRDPLWRSDLFQFRKLVKMKRKKDILSLEETIQTTPEPKVRRRPG